MLDKAGTEPEKLNLSYQIGKSAGLHYVYSGNRPGEVGATENTYCPSCDDLLIERYGNQTLQNRLGVEGKCPKCETPIPGVWTLPFRGPNRLRKVEETQKVVEALLRLKEPEEVILGET